MGYVLLGGCMGEWHGPVASTAYQTTVWGEGKHLGVFSGPSRYTHAPFFVLPSGERKAETVQASCMPR